MTAIWSIATPVGDKPATVPSAAPTKRRAGLPLLLLLAWLIVPLVPVVLWSVARGWFFPALLPAEISLAAWARAFAPGSDVWRALGTSVSVSAAAAALGMLIGVPAGRALGMHAFRGKRWVEMLVLAPILVPGLGVAMGLHAVMIRLGLTGTAGGVVLVFLVPVLPYVVLISASVFATHDRAFEAQARGLGASSWQTLRHVTLPMVAPGLSVAAAFAFLVAWSQYGLTLLVGGGRVVTMPLLLGQSIAAGRNDLAGVAAVLTILPGLAVLVLTSTLLGRGGRR